MKKLKSRQELQELRRLYSSALAAEQKKVLVCAGTGCISSGSLLIFDRLRALIEEQGLRCEVELEKEPHDHSIGLKKSGCHGFCEMGPLVRIEPEGYLYTKVKLEDCEEIVSRTILKGELLERLAYQKNGKIYPRQEEIPFYQKQTRLLLEHCGHINASSVREYLGIGGYTAFEKALFDLSPDEIIEEITAANLGAEGAAASPPGANGRRCAGKTRPRNTSSAMATRATQAHLWIEASWRATRIKCWRACSLQAWPAGQRRVTSMCAPNIRWL